MATQAEFIDAFAKAAGLTKAEADRIARAYAEVAVDQAKTGFAALRISAASRRSPSRPARPATRAPARWLMSRPRPRWC